MGTYGLNATQLVSALQSTPGGVGSQILALLQGEGFSGNATVPTVYQPGTVPSGSSQYIAPPAGTALDVVFTPAGTGTTPYSFIASNQIQAVSGSGNVSIIDYGAGPNTLFGGQGGDDLLEVFAGNNSLVAGTGNSTLQAGFGNDTLVGGTVAGAHTTLIGGSGNDSFSMTAGSNSVVAGSGSNQVTLGSGNDTLMGGAGPTSVTLGTGTESIKGGSGAISIYTTGALVSNSSTVTGGVHTLTFTGGQTVTVNDTNSNITIHFQNGTNTPV